MDFRFQKNIYPILVILLAFLCSCHSLPPTEMLAPEKIPFEPARLSWEKVSMPPEMLSNWYRQGKFYLSVTESALQVEDFIGNIESIAKSESYSVSYYRIISYSVLDNQYYATYFRNLTEEEVQVIHADTSAGDEEGASLTPVPAGSG